MTPNSKKKPTLIATRPYNVIVELPAGRKAKTKFKQWLEALKKDGEILSYADPLPGKIREGSMEDDVAIRACLKHALPWLAKGLADGVHQNCSMPADLGHTIVWAEKLLKKR